MKTELQNRLKTYPMHYMTWQDFDDHVTNIIKAMDAVNYRPDYIHGIARGGLPLSVTLSNRIGVPMIIDDGITLAKSGKNILVCDDLSDTGDTFFDIQERYKNKDCSRNLKTTALLYRINTKVVPDFFSQYLDATMESDEYRWIHFPWE